MTFLPNGSTTAFPNASPPANPTLNTSPSDFASNDEDWPALPQPSPKPNPTPPIP